MPVTGSRPLLRLITMRPAHAPLRGMFFAGTKVIKIPDWNNKKSEIIQ